MVGRFAPPRPFPPGAPPVRPREPAPKAYTFSLTKPSLEPSVMSDRSLRAVLDAFGEFPPKYRLTIWRSLLRLPHSRVAYGGLAARGTHPAYAADALAQRCPGVPPRVLHRLRRTCSALAWWSPVFAECEGLPALALPFVRAFAADDVGAFEALATVLLHVTPNWFRDFPNPPMHVISTVEQMVAHRDLELACHADERLGGLWRLAWLLLSNLFSDVFTPADWLKVWDHLLMGGPSFPACLAAAYILRCRTALAHSRNAGAAALLLTGPHGAPDCDAVLRLAYELAESYGDAPVAHPPIAAGTTYVPFGPVPEARVAAAAAESEALRTAADDAARRRRIAAAVDERTTRVGAMQAAWEEEAARMAATEAAWRAKRDAQVAALRSAGAAARDAGVEARLRALSVREGALRSRLVTQKGAWSAELRRLASQVEAQRAEALEAARAARQDEAVRAMEAEADMAADAADAEAAHVAARERLRLEASAAGAARAVRAQRAAAASAFEDDARDVRRAHAAARRAHSAAAREEAAARAAAAEAQLRLQLQEEGAMMGAERERLRRAAAEAEAEITASAAEAERSRVASAAAAHAHALASAAAADADAFRDAARRRADAVAAARAAAAAEADARGAAEAAVARAARSAEVGVLLADRRAALAAAEREDEAAAQRALAAAAEERRRDAALRTQLEAAAAAADDAAALRAHLAFGRSGAGMAAARFASPRAEDEPAGRVADAAEAEALARRLRDARRELQQAQAAAASAEARAAAVRAAAEPWARAVRA